MRLLLWIFLGLLSPLLGRADEYGNEVARQHAARAGAKLGELKSLYAEGRTLINNEVIDFKIWAERPNRLREESSSPTRTVIQCYDGEHEPWLSHTNIRGGQPLRMNPPDRKDFLANADFDGPLVDFEKKGFTVDYAGEDEVAKREASKVLVMGKQNDVSFLWVDKEFHDVVKRLVFRMSGEKRISIETYFADFRAVGGVRQPHRIETKTGARTLYVMAIAKMDANSPKVTAESFQAPANWPKLGFGPTSPARR